MMNNHRESRNHQDIAWYAYFWPSRELPKVLKRTLSISESRKLHIKQNIENFSGRRTTEVILESYI